MLIGTGPMTCIPAVNTEHVGMFFKVSFINLVIGMSTNRLILIQMI